MMLQNFISKEADVSEPIWFRILILFCVTILSLTSLVNFILFCFQKHFRKVLGLVTLFSAFSNLCLAICWGYMLTSSAFESSRLFVAFVTLFCIYECIFNKTGYTWYFWRYLKDKTPFVRLQGIVINNRPRQQNRTRHQELQLLEVEAADEGEIDSGSEDEAPLPLIRAEDYPDVPPQLIDEQNSLLKELVRICAKLKQGYSRLETNDQTMNRRLEKLEKPIRGTPLKRINLKIIICVLIMTGCLTATYTFFDALGKGFFGDWSIEWKAEIQNLGVIVCVFTGGFDIIMSLFTLIYFQRENFSETVQLLRDKEDLTAEEKQKKHYLSYLCKFIIAMTILNILFLAANVYANKATEKATQEWIYTTWKVIYFLSPALQSFFLFFLKITERK